MKNVLMLMLGLTIGTASFANSTTPTTPTATVSVTNDQRIKLIIGAEDAKATVVLRDQEGHTLYKNNVDLLEGYKQMFNISGLPLGNYQIAITVDGQSTIKTFAVGLQPAQTVVKLDS